MYLNTDEDVKNTGFEPIPAGRYQAMILGVELEQTKNKKEGKALKGEYLKVSFAVLNDKYANRKVSGIYNIANDKQQAENIGKGQFGRLCKAVEVSFQMSDLPGDYIARKVEVESKLQVLKQKVVLLDLAVTVSDRGYKNNEVREAHPKDMPASAGNATTSKASVTGAMDIPFA